MDSELHGTDASVVYYYIPVHVHVVLSQQYMYMYVIMPATGITFVLLLFEKGLVVTVH